MIKIKDLRDGYSKIIKQRDNTNEFNRACNRVTGNLNQVERMRDKGASPEECDKLAQEAMKPLEEWYLSHPKTDKDEYGGVFMKYNLRRKRSIKIKSKRKKCSCNKK
jgi:hypothetical protein